MSTDIQSDLADFHEYPSHQLAQREVIPSPERALVNWRARAESIAAIQAGLDAFEEGRTNSLAQFSTAFHARHGLTVLNG